MGKVSDSKIVIRVFYIVAILTLSVYLVIFELPANKDDLDQDPNIGNSQSPPVEDINPPTVAKPETEEQVSQEEIEGKKLTIPNPEIRNQKKLSGQVLVPKLSGSVQKEFLNQLEVCLGKDCKGLGTDGKYEFAYSSSDVLRDKVEIKYKGNVVAYMDIGKAKNKSSRGLTLHPYRINPKQTPELLLLYFETQAKNIAKEQNQPEAYNSESFNLSRKRVWLASETYGENSEKLEDVVVNELNMLRIQCQISK